MSSSSIKLGDFFAEHGTSTDDGVLLDPGGYEIEVVEAFVGKNKPGIVLKARPLSGPFAGQPFLSWISASAKAAGILWTTLKRWGLEEEWIKGAQLEDVAAALRGRVASVEVEHFEKSDGAAGNSIRFQSIALKSAPPLPAVGGVPTAAMPQTFAEAQAQANATGVPAIVPGPQPLMVPPATQPLVPAAVPMTVAAAQPAAVAPQPVAAAAPVAAAPAAVPITPAPTAAAPSPTPAVQVVDEPSF